MTRLDVFDKLVHNCPIKVFHGSGWRPIKLPDHPDVLGFAVNDRLREFILSEACASRNAITASERSEFLWKIFEHLVLGGNVNQFEDDAKIYRTISKLVYKGLIRCAQHTCRINT